MTEDIEQVRVIKDPEERARAAHALLGVLQALAADASSIRAGAVTSLIRTGRSHADIAGVLGTSKALIGQINARTAPSAEAPPPEHALLAPDPGPLLICVIAKTEAERGGPALTETTVAARDEIDRLAASWSIEVAHETVPRSGVISLNRQNLAVLIGPRSSPLVEQALSADPVIKWRPADTGNWYITDTQTGCEYHSEFDEGPSPAGPWPHTCYAHVGRIRRPDGEGGWLCLAGEHRPGVAGAAEFICREAGTLWPEVHRGLWSAVIRVQAAESGKITGIERITPVYVHGKR